MKNAARILSRFAVFFLVSFAAMAQGPWQQLTMPTVSEAAANFRYPPHEYGAIHWAIWGGALTRERIVQEFDSLVANSIYVVNFGPARGMTPKYLSPEYFDLMKFAVDEARKRGMKVWIADEGTYPSGFAGGLIGEKFPQFVMQGIVADMRVSLTAGQTISIPLPPDTLGVYVENGSDHTTTVLPMPKDGHLKYTAPNTGSDPYTPNWLWDVVFVRHVYRSSPTRYINREDGTYNKDARYPLIDYLDPDATRAFMSTTHEVYKKLFGDEFGNTVLGFFGDETDYASAIPWTPALLDEFRKQKGYDLQPYLPAVLRPPVDRRGAARQGRLLRRVERHLPRQLLRRPGRVVRQEQYGVPGAPGRRRGHDASDSHRGRLLPRRAVRAGSRDRQPEPVAAAHGAHPGRKVGREQQLPQAGLLGRAPVRQAQGLGRGRRRSRHRWQVPVGLSTGAGRQRMQIRVPWCATE